MTEQKGTINAKAKSTMGLRINGKWYNASKCWTYADKLNKGDQVEFKVDEEKNEIYFIKQTNAEIQPASEYKAKGKEWSSDMSLEKNTCVRQGYAVNLAIAMMTFETETAKVLMQLSKDKAEATKELDDARLRIEGIKESIFDLASGFEGMAKEMKNEPVQGSK